MRGWSWWDELRARWVALPMPPASDYPETDQQAERIRHVLRACGAAEHRQRGQGRWPWRLRGHDGFEVGDFADPFAVVVYLSSHQLETQPWLRECLLHLYAAQLLRCGYQVQLDEDCLSVKPPEPGSPPPPQLRLVK